MVVLFAYFPLIVCYFVMYNILCVPILKTSHCQACDKVNYLVIFSLNEHSSLSPFVTTILFYDTLAFPTYQCLL